MKIKPGEQIPRELFKKLNLTDQIIYCGEVVKTEAEADRLNELLEVAA